MKNSQFILCVIFIIFSSCKKSSEPAQPPYYPLPQEFLDYAKFTVGNYFIYRDSATNSLDSVIVTKSELTQKVLISGGGYSSYFSDRLDQYLIMVDTLGYRQNWLMTTSKATYYGLFVMESDSSEILLGSYATNTIPTLTIEGKVYNNVLEVKDPDFAVIYWAKGVGIIKRVHTDLWWTNRSQTWTLVRNG
jgi:hypothetical protein